ncbi:MarR family winged helix-turn-helix transcriptional regulator [Streptomyces pristinaespiralis]|jgi:DNA-binding MarR family transcriptional regulator|uniref:MarR family transcriptional regulator n=1 Tax=Streptomyces pristinaespiralis TaxID=38300 RepID=A0A0M4DMV3_STRPR|nr:MarR family transcriptional regulator [Streptomyces pristinaespiralis]ALC19007.1 MarR family transcriptional regulator [Streptomyces pristinaespiralis]QMU17884.1 MarR family transcriptional regulator [Streptomyces pristinaespiralis]
MPTLEAAAVAAELRTAMGKLTRRVKHEDRIPHGQVAVLGVLDRDGAMTTSDLATDQRVRPQSMARVVGLLLEQGLVTRRAHPTDGRKSLLELSDAGRAALEAERGRRAGWLAMAIEAELTQDERELLARSAALMERLAARRQDLPG